MFCISPSKVLKLRICKLNWPPKYGYAVSSSLTKHEPKQKLAAMEILLLTVSLPMSMFSIGNQVLFCLQIKSKLSTMEKNTFAIKRCALENNHKSVLSKSQTHILCAFDAHVVTGPSPDMAVECDSTWNKKGMLEVYVHWSLPNSTSLMETIEEFQVMQKPNSGNTKHILTEV